MAVHLTATSPPAAVSIEITAAQAAADAAQAAGTAQATAAEVARARADEEARLAAEAAHQAQQLVDTYAEEAAMRASLAIRVAKTRARDANVARQDAAAMTAAHTAAAQAISLRTNPAPALAMTDGSPTGGVEPHEWPAASDVQALDGALPDVIRSPRPFASPVADATAPDSATAASDDTDPPQTAAEPNRPSGAGPAAIADTVVYTRIGNPLVGSQLTLVPPCIIGGRWTSSSSCSASQSASDARGNAMREARLIREAAEAKARGKDKPKKP